MVVLLLPMMFTMNVGERQEELRIDASVEGETGVG